MTEILGPYGLTVAAVIDAAIATAASAHVLLNKREVRAAIGWVALIWLVPFAGAAFYGLFGINRIRRRANELRPQRLLPEPPAPTDSPTPPALAESLPAGGRHLSALAELVGAIVPAPLAAGNTITPLTSGEHAYGEMVAAIDASERTVGMTTFIFDDDRAGQLFAAALERAAARGVEVRVLVDGVGARYSWPRITPRLRRMGLRVAEFLPTFVPLYAPYANLRNHRKCMVVDGTVAFTGGMNVRQGYLSPLGRGGGSLNDVHFRIAGPVVAQLADVFAEDWAFVTGEGLRGEGWFPGVTTAGTAIARAIPGGPDEKVERIRLTILGALSQTRRRARIVTPYFVPDQGLITALAVASLRGVEVEIVTPGRSNLLLVQWASRAQIGQVLAQGVRVWTTPPPFDHSKLMTVDGHWTLMGSANWDQRSLRLNFELDVECYDADFTAEVDAVIDSKIAAARPLVHDEVAGRPLAVKLRDGVAWLLSPYL